MERLERVRESARDVCRTLDEDALGYFQSKTQYTPFNLYQSFSAAPNVQAIEKMADGLIAGYAEPTLIVDTHSRIVACNAAMREMIEIPQGDGLSHYLFDLLPELEIVVGDLVAGGIPLTDHPIAISSSAGWREFLLNAGLTPLGDGLPILTMISLRASAEPNEIPACAEVASDADPDFDYFSHFASNELRAPVRFMNKIAHLLLIENQNCLNETGVTQINMLLNCTQEMDGLIENALKLSQIATEPLARKIVDTGKVVRAALDELLPQYEGRIIHCKIDALPPCYANAESLKQLFLNLLSNALKYTRNREEATIHIGSMMIEKEVVYFVRDNGIGFDAKAAGLLFQPFHRLPNARAYEGAGLGMALARRIAERHHGRVWADGRPDNGATFYFKLEEKMRRSA